jgi:hypothetical protein
MAKKKGKSKMSATPVPPRGPKKAGTGTGKNPMGYNTAGKGKK